MSLIKVHEEINGQAVQVFDQVSINDFLHHDTGYCRWPLCEVFSVHDGLCIGHKMYSKVPEPVKVKPSIAKVSDKRKKINKEYNKIKDEIISKDDRCKIKSPNCTGKAQGLNHSQKRSPSNLTKIDNLVQCCNPCNLYLETHSEWAMANGHTVSRFKK